MGLYGVGPRHLRREVTVSFNSMAENKRYDGFSWAFSVSKGMSVGQMTNKASLATDSYHCSLHIGDTGDCPRKMDLSSTCSLTARMIASILGS